VLSLLASYEVRGTVYNVTWMEPRRAAKWQYKCVWWRYWRVFCNLSGNYINKVKGV
jgi:hypothetical protein